MPLMCKHSDKVQKGRVRMLNWWTEEDSLFSGMLSLCYLSAHAFHMKAIAAY